MRNILLAVMKLMLGVLWIFMALLTWLWAYGIYKSIGRVRTQSDAGEFMTPNQADVYPFFFVICALLLISLTIAFRKIQWPWPSYLNDHN